MEIPKKPPLGEILVRRGVLAAEDLERAERASQQMGLPLASTLLRLGAVPEPQLIAALAERHGVPGIDLDASAISTAVLPVVPLGVARGHLVLPLAREGDMLQVAVADPSRKEVLDELSFATGATAVPYVCAQVRIVETIDEAYGARGRGEPLWRGARCTAEAEHLEILRPVPDRSSVSIDVEIPEEQFEAIGDQRALPSRPADARPLVLAVDDEVEILDLVSRALGTRDIDVVRATRGGEVLAMLEQHAPDVVLLDAMLPEVQGFELCERIKKSPRYAHIPVLIVSAMASGWNFAQDVRRLYGADGFMSKPFRIAELVRWVEEALERTRGRPRSPALEQALKLSALECRRAADLYRAGSLDEALAAAGRAVSADPFDPRAHFVLGTVLNAMGQTYQAISQYERVAELAPTLFPALKNLAVLYERQGFKAKAVEMWMRALEHSPSDAVRKTIKAHLFALL